MTPTQGGLRFSRNTMPDVRPRAWSNDALSSRAAGGRAKGPLLSPSNPLRPGRPLLVSRSIPEPLKRGPYSALESLEPGQSVKFGCALNYAPARRCPSFNRARGSHAQTRKCYDEHLRARTFASGPHPPQDFELKTQSLACGIICAMVTPRGLWRRHRSLLNRPTAVTANAT
jgi:hypothetical protein